MIRVWSRLAVALAGTIVCLPFVVAAAGAPSPFMPPNSQKPVEEVRDATLDSVQLSGISIIGDTKRFNLVDTKAQRSFWVQLDEAENGISVESYNPEDDSILVRHGSNTKRIALRRSVIVALNRPPPLPGSDLPGVPPPLLIPDHIQGVDEVANPTTPKQVKQAEFEARMLVSDLLDISIRERARQKALREQRANEAKAQRRPAKGGGS